MNDLRSQHRPLAPVRSLGPRTGEIVSAPPKSRPKKAGNPLFQDSRTGTDGDRNGDGGDDDRPERGPQAVDGGLDNKGNYVPPLTFPVSRDLNSMPVTAVPSPPTDSPDISDIDASDDIEPEMADPDDADHDGGRSRRGRPAGKRNKAPASRPTKRREVLDGDEPEDDKFPWHHQFDDDEPQELQAKSPLLSRAFRSSVG